jgi:hypothetical protein
MAIEEIQKTINVIDKLFKIHHYNDTIVMMIPHENEQVWEEVKSTKPPHTTPKATTPFKIPKTSLPEPSTQSKNTFSAFTSYDDNDNEKLAADESIATLL